MVPRMIRNKMNLTRFNVIRATACVEGFVGLVLAHAISPKVAAGQKYWVCAPFAFSSRNQVAPC
jgi:hypothetical protein